MPERHVHGVGQLARELFSIDGFMPHGHCYLWKPELVSLHVGSDVLIGTAYVVIALTLWGLVRRIRLPFSPMVLAFGVFIGACGLTHYMEVWTLWTPDYWISGLVKAVTAFASVATGVYLVRLRPTIVSVVQGAALAEERRLELEAKNRELERLYVQVKELDEVRVRFFANVSHELRTPLALVLGTLEKLARAADGDGRRDLEVARRNARVLLRHVNDLLDVARLEEGQMPMRWARADVAEIVRSTAAQFEAAARDRGVALAVDAPAALAADVDPEKLQRIVANLVGNAFKFTPDGGRVRVALAAEGERVRLEVEDTGPGVPREARATIFERFRQDARGGEQGEGTGLGLAITKEFVALHHGAIAVGDGAGGRGARFTVHLPRSAPPGVVPAPEPGRRAPLAAVRGMAEEVAAPLPEPPPGAPARPDAPRVLVVEDHAEMARFVAAVLGREFRVATAADAAQGVAQAEALQPDAVVTDVTMPAGGGEALLEGVRARPALAAVPVVVLSAREDERLRVRMLEGGAQDYLVKPFAAEELLARVRNAVHAKRAREVLEAENASRARDLEAAARELARRKRELERAVETEQVAREQALRASQVKSRFLGMASHELRTPLTSMRLAIEALLDPRREPLPEAKQRAAERIDHASRRLLALVETLLEYTRAETGRLVVRPERFDLASLARDVVEEVLPQAQKKLLALALEPHAPLGEVESDPRLVRIVLVNLLVNAVKYTEAGSVAVRLGRDGARAWLEVVDTGPGIPGPALARVFEPFEQGGEASARAAGVGLGLSLVKGIADALGAAIAATSEEGRGSRFRVTLPERPPGAAAGGAQGPGGAGP